MKKLGKPETLFILLTLLCLSFTAGYFTGRSSSAAVIAFERLPAPSAAVGAPLVSGAGRPSAEGAPGAASGSAAAQVPQEASSPVSPPQPSPSAEAPSGKININTASSAELEELPGIGEALAQKIIEYRQLVGGFKSIEQIMEVKGIGEKKFQAIKDMITV